MQECLLLTQSGHFKNCYIAISSIRSKHWGGTGGATRLCAWSPRGRTSDSCGGDIFINVDPSKGSNSLATGTQQIPVGIGIPIHRHFFMDEAFYVIEGSGSLILDDLRYPIVKGASIFIPMNSWHGFENASDQLVLLWTVAPAGLECFFREIATPPGAPPIQRSKKQLNEIASKYGTEFR